MLRLLRVGAVLDERGADPRQAHVADAEGRRLLARHLLLEDHLLDERAAAAADVLRPVEADPTFREQILVPLVERRQAREAAFEIAVAARAFRQVITDEGAHLGAEVFLFGCEGEVHEAS